MDSRTHFELRLRKIVKHLLVEKCEVSGLWRKALWDTAKKYTEAIMKGELDKLPKEIIDDITSCIGKVKKPIRYDIKINTG